MKLSSKNAALTAIFAALYYVLSLITPYIPAVAIPEIKISLEALIASVYGLILGPYLGALAAFVGALVAWTLPPGSMSPYGMPFLLSPPLNALVTGLIFYRKWKVGFSIYAILIIAFLFTPPVQPIYENLYVGIAVLWDKIIALLLILPCIKFARQLST
ncbi:MAG: ECF transporter S component, partial [Candidatus Bathyarchaeales archaeon]